MDSTEEVRWHKAATESCNEFQVCRNFTGIVPSFTIPYPTLPHKNVSVKITDVIFNVHSGIRGVSELRVVSEDKPFVLHVFFVSLLRPLSSASLCPIIYSGLPRYHSHVPIKLLPSST